MSLKKTLVLGLLLAGLLFYVVRFDRPRQEAERLKDHLFPKTAATQIASIDITRRTKDGVQQYLLENAGASPTPQEEGKTPEQVSAEGWTIRGIPHSKLDSGPLTTLVRALQTIKGESRIPKEEVDADKKLYGLAEPEVSLTVSVAGGSATTLNFGKRSEYLGQRYLEVLPAGTLYLVGEELFQQANRIRDDYRDRTPFEGIDVKADRMELRWPDRQIGLLKEQSGWKVAGVTEHPAGDKQLNGLRQEIRNMRVAEFVDLEGELKGTRTPTEIGLGEPDFSLVLTEKEAGGSGERQRVVRMKRERSQTGNHTWVHEDGAPVMYRLSFDVVERINRDPDFYRLRELFAFDLDRVKKAVIEAEGRKTVTLEREAGSSWKVNGRPGDPVFVSEVLRNLSQLEAAGFARPGGAFGFDRPRVKIVVTLGDEGGTQTTDRTLLVGAEAPKELLTLADLAPAERDAAKAVYASVGDGGAPFVLTEQSVKRLTPAEEALVKQENSGKPAPEAEVEEIALDDSPGAEAVDPASPDGGE